MGLHAFDVGSLLGDDVDDGGERHTAIERRCRTAQHLNLSDFVERDAEVGGGNVGGEAVQAVAVEHDEYLHLSVAVDAAHGDVDVVVAVDDVHARHVSGQHLLQIAGAAVLNHLLGDERGGHRYLVELFGLARRGGDGGVATGFDVLHHVDEALWVGGRRAVVGVLVQHQTHVVLGFSILIESQAAQRQHAVGTDAQTEGKVVEVASECPLCLFQTAYVVVLFRLVVEGAVAFCLALRHQG